MRKIVLSIFTILMLSLTLSAQNQRVSGTVTNGDGDPLIGATVIQKDTQNAAVTGLNGEYTLDVPANAVLVISYTGYNDQEVNVNNRTIVNAEMETAAEVLDRVVVIGYGTGQDISTVAGAVSTVDAKIVKDKPVANIADAIQGQVSGLSVTTTTGEPGAGSEILLHGEGSLNSGTAPLYVVDGIPSVSGVMTRMSNNDIEEIVVLKDASATAIYGSRAANGVIYITTKKGRKDLPPSIRLNANYAISAPVTSRRHMMDGQTLLDWQLENKEINIDSYLKYKSRLDKEGSFDWFKFLFPSKDVYNVDFSIEGGSESSNYYVSGSYSDEEGIAPGSFFTRYTFRSNINTNVTKWLQFGANLGLSYDQSRSAATTPGSSGANPSAPGMLAMMAPTYLYPHDENGRSIIALIEGNDLLVNPYEEVKYRPQTHNNLFLNGNAFMNINPIKGLNIRSVFAAEANDYTNAYLHDPRWPWNQGDGAVQRSFSRFGTFTSTNTIEYKFDINREHNFTLLAGHEGITSTSQNFLAMTLGQVDMRNMLLGLGDYTDMNYVSEGYSAYSYLSAFARANYNYKEKYSIDLTFRNDASSKFGKNMRNAQFYAVGLLWNAKKESFLADNRTISDLILRVTFGTQGNSSLPNNYLHMGLIGSTTYGGAAWGLASAGNPMLTWENQQHFNAGFELGLWNKLSLNVSFYNRYTYDMLQQIPVSATTGFTTNWMNVGEVQNRGIDIDLNWTIFRDKDWDVYFSTVFGYNHNKILSLFPGTTEVPYVNSDLIDRVGGPIGGFYLPISLGVDPRDGFEMYLDANGNPTKDITRVAYHPVEGKHRIAPYQGGFNFGATWRGLSLVTQFSWKVGGYLISNDAFFLESSISTGMGRPDYMQNIWRQPGDNTGLPSYINQTQLSDRHLQSTSFLRLKNVTLSYEFPKDLMAKTKVIQGARVFFIGRNLLTLTEFSGYDPEVSYAQFSLGDYPMSRQYAFGVELTF